jgi:truncated hemoglobin YjbI
MAKALVDSEIPEPLQRQLLGALAGTADWMRNKNE